MTRSPSRRTRLTALTAGVTMALTGCAAGTTPGAAAVVGSSTITHDRVDAVAQALCAANIQGAEARGEAAPNLPSRGARQGALEVLLESELSRQFGERRGAEANRQQISRAVLQNELGLSMLDEDDRAAFRGALADYAEGQLLLIEVGRAALQRSGRTDVTDEQALAEGQRLRARWVDSVEVEVDPRYGDYTDGTLNPGGTSLSVPVSDTAKAGASTNPSATWVAELPASQRCS